MKRILAILLAGALLLLSGCGSTDDRVYARMLDAVAGNPIPGEIPEGLEYKSQLFTEDPALDPLPEDDLRGLLTVKVRTTEGINTNSADLQLYAQEFTMLHPKVAFKFEVFGEYDSTNIYDASTLERVQTAAQEKFRVEMMSRKADYIIYDSDYLLSSFRSMSENNMLLDMWQYFENDPDMREEDYFLEALNAFCVDGKLTMVPYSFTYDGVFLNRAVLESIGADPEKISSVTVEQLYDWYDMALALDPDLQLFFSAPGKDEAFEIELPACLDFETRKARFDSPSFLRYLERSINAIDDDPDIWEENRGWAKPPTADELLRCLDTGIPHDGSRIQYWKPTMEVETVYRLMTYGRRSFAVLSDTWLGPLSFLQNPLEYMAGPYPLLSSDGKLGLSSDDYFLVPSCISNPDLAWEFIKYCMGERASGPINDGMFFQTGQWYSTHPFLYDIPVNRKSFRRLGDYMGDFTKCNTHSFGYGDFQAVDTPKWEASVDQVLSLPLVNSAPYRTFPTADLREEYYRNELTTPEQMAEKLQSRATIWLNE